MLDGATKVRIDSARDILVGKVPDPNHQVGQITIALIHKFMDDTAPLRGIGRQGTFLAGELRNYRLAQLLDKRFNGQECLLIYAEGIEKMNENRNITQISRHHP